MSDSYLFNENFADYFKKLDIKGIKPMACANCSGKPIELDIERCDKLIRLCGHCLIKESGLFSCTACGAVFLPHDVKILSKDRKNLLCYKCSKKLLFCKECDGHFYEGECPRCSHHLASALRSAVSFQDRVIDVPSSRLIDSRRYIGLEMEIISDYRLADWRDLPGIVIGHDGSLVPELPDQKAIELICPPALGKAFDTQVDAIYGLNFKSNFTTSTHIHIGLLGEDKKQLGRLVAVYRVMEYAFKAMFPSRWTNTYCTFLPSNFPTSYKLVHFVPAQVKAAWYQEYPLGIDNSDPKHNRTRYRAFNLHPLFSGIGTFEMRHSHNLNRSCLYHWVNCILGMCVLAHKSDVKNILQELESIRGVLDRYKAYCSAIDLDVHKQFVTWIEVSVSRKLC